jgi:sugar lactone lactonase YvrE
MRRVTFAALILILPAIATVILYFILKPGKQPTRRDAIGVVKTFAGSGAPGVEDGPASKSSFSDPFGIAIDKKGNILVADGGESNRIRVITPAGNVETIAGGSEGFEDGKLTSASFNTPSGLAIDKRGNVIIADTSNNRIRRLDPDGMVTTVAGSGEPGFRDGIGEEARFDGPVGVAVDDDGNIFVADTYNDRIRRIAANGTVSTVAGTGEPGYVNGRADSAQFDTPCGVAVDRQGNLFIADTGNHAIRRFTPSGEVGTFGGDRDSSSSEITVRLFDQPVGIAITHDGFLFVTDSGRGRVWRITPEGETTTFAGSRTGYGEGGGEEARFNGPSGIAIDREGSLYVADTQNYLIRKVSPLPPASVETRASDETRLYIQPISETPAARAAVPGLDVPTLGFGQPFLWPLNPQDQWHEVTGLVGEARGAPGGVALHHLHSGLDIRGNLGDPVVSVVDEKVSNPLPTWDYGGSSEGIHVGLMSYIHIRVGRDKVDQIQDPAKFIGRVDESGEVIGVRVRRGTRFKIGAFLGTLNKLYHVHMNLGPWNAQANPIQFPFMNLTDAIPPVVEPNGIEVMSQSGVPLKQKREGRLVLSGDVDIVVTAYDRVDGNTTRRKLGLYKVGYQLLRDGGGVVKGFEKPLVNIDFSRLPPDDESVFVAYAEGSGVSAYGGVTRFKYIVTNRVRDGEARDGVLRTSALAPGNYTLRVVAEDYAGNRAEGPSTELQVTVLNP